MEIETIQNVIEFSNEPIFIKEENKQIVYRFNIGEYSPYVGKFEGYKPVKWDYNNISAKTSNPEGIYAILPEDEGAFLIFIDRLYQEILGRNKGEETVILKLEIDKLNIKNENSCFEVSFPECNIIEKLTIEDFIIRLYPKYYYMVEFYKIAKNDPTEHNKEMFQQIWDRYTAEILKIRNDKYLKNGLITQSEYNERTKYFSTPEPGPIEQIHGREHSLRVIQNGMILSIFTGVNLKVVQTFGNYHDCRRHNDGNDPEHGKRAADLLRAIRRNAPTGLNDTEFEELCFACENHTSLHRSGNITIDTCFDADRLDLKRLGIKPDPEKMATEIGAFYANNPDRLTPINLIIT